MSEKRLAPGYYKVGRTQGGRAKTERTLSMKTVRELVAPIKSRTVAERIVKRYEASRNGKR